MINVVSELTYVTRSVERPGFYNYKPAEDEPDRAPETRRHEMVVEDARGYVETLDLDTEGLAIVSLQTKANDLYDSEQVRAVYYPEVESLVQNYTGASRVVAFDFNVRNRELAETNKDVQKPVTFVHNDYTIASGPQRVRDLIGGEEAESLVKKRFAVINVWKPITGPVKRSPLAVCDASSMQQSDFMETDLLYPDRSGEIYSVSHRPEHHWLYVSNMAPTEAMLLKCYDSAESGVARFTAHSAIEIPDSGDAPARESIEVRTLVFY